MIRIVARSVFRQPADARKRSFPRWGIAESANQDFGLAVRRIATSADESHPLNSAAPLATILNDVFTFCVGGAFLKLHCLFAYNAAQETYQRAFIVVR